MTALGNFPRLFGHWFASVRREGPWVAFLWPSEGVGTDGETLALDWLSESAGTVVGNARVGLACFHSGELW